MAETEEERRARLDKRNEKTGLEEEQRFLQKQKHVWKRIRQLWQKSQEMSSLAL